MRRALLFLALCGTACFRMTVKSGRPLGRAPTEYDAKWHSGVIFGLAELSGPYDLSDVCPLGWASIRTETSFVNGVVHVLTAEIYTPQTVTIRCAAR